MRLNIKSWGKWLLVLLVLGVVAGTAWRVVSDRKAKQQALTAAPKETLIVELATSDSGLDNGRVNGLERS